MMLYGGDPHDSEASRRTYWVRVMPRWLLFVALIVVVAAVVAAAAVVDIEVESIQDFVRPFEHVYCLEILWKIAPQRPAIPHRYVSDRLGVYLEPS